MGIEATVVYQPALETNRYFTAYKYVKEEYGGTQPCILLAVRKDPESGWPIIHEDPLAVGGMFCREATDKEKKALLSKALENYRPKEKTPAQVEAEEYRDTLWKNIWDEFTSKTTRYE